MSYPGAKAELDGEHRGKLETMRSVGAHINARRYGPYGDVYKCTVIFVDHEGRRYVGKHTSTVSVNACTDLAWDGLREAIHNGTVKLALDIPSVRRAAERMGLPG